MGKVFCVYDGNDRIVKIFVNEQDAITFADCANALCDKKNESLNKDIFDSIFHAIFAHDKHFTIKPMQVCETSDKPILAFVVRLRYCFDSEQ